MEARHVMIRTCGKQQWFLLLTVCFFSETSWVKSASLGKIDRALQKTGKDDTILSIPLNIQVCGQEGLCVRMPGGIENLIL
jgi:hypothetical protein